MSWSVTEEQKIKLYLYTLAQLVVGYQFLVLDKSQLKEISNSLASVVEEIGKFKTNYTAVANS